MANQVTLKGQVSVPKRVREHLGLKPGSKVEFEIDAKGQVLLRNAAPLAKKRRRRGLFAAITTSGAIVP